MEDGGVDFGMRAWPTVAIDTYTPIFPQTSDFTNKHTNTHTNTTYCGTRRIAQVAISG